MCNERKGVKTGTFIECVMGTNVLGKASRNCFFLDDEKSMASDLDERNLRTEMEARFRMLEKTVLQGILLCKYNILETCG